MNIIIMIVFSAIMFTAAALAAAKSADYGRGTPLQCLWHWSAVLSQAAGTAAIVISL